jgi:hypothetical protein
MAKTITLTVDASRYEDEDDCLAAAADDAAETLHLEGWDLNPRWADNQRNEIILDVPAPNANDAQAWDAIRTFGGHPGR